MRVAPRQLALSLDHAESFAREDFLSGPSNAAALALMELWPQWPCRTVVLSGPEGSVELLGRHLGKRGRGAAGRHAPSI